MVAYLVLLPREQLASLGDSGAHRGGVSLAPDGVDQVRSLDEDDVWCDECGELILRRPSPVEGGEEALHDLDVFSRGVGRFGHVAILDREQPGR